MTNMRPGCMAWPHPKHHCGKPGVLVGHGIYLCSECQETAIKDLVKVQKDKARADAELKKLAQQMAGQRPNHRPILPHRGEVPAGRFEENRGKH
jgi:hypothetical protein